MTLDRCQFALLRATRILCLLMLGIAAAGCGGGSGGDILVQPVDIHIADATVIEGNAGSSSRALAVSLSEPSDQVVTVDYVTRNGSATAGSDYSTTSGTLTFSPGQTAAAISIPVVGDTVVESNETVMVELSNPVNGVLPQDQATVTIQNDDGATLPQISIADAAIAEGDAGSATLSMTVTLSQASSQMVSVGFATANGTAAAGSDYAGMSGSLTFNAGETTHQINIIVFGDTAIETNETVLVNLSNAVGGTVQDAQGVLTITNDDATALPAITIADANVAEGSSGTTTGAVTVTLSTTSNQTVTAAYSTAAGTATAGADYTSASSTVSFAPGETSRVINVSIVGDTTDEANETVLINLANPVNAIIQDNQAILTIVDDDTSFGLDSRPSNTTCVAPARGTASTGVASVNAFPTAPGFNGTTKLLQAPGDASRWFVLEQSGRVRVFNTANPASVSTYLDFTDRVNEANSGGLLGMAFHPNFPATREVFISYTGTGSAQESRISRITLDNATTPVSTTEQILLRADQSSGTHKGGDIAFGSDNALYISIGDSSANNDPNERGQDTTRLAGKMLRINVLGTGAAYTIPSDNPFAPNAHCGPASNAQSCPEIFALGFRNPWRWSFDEQSGVLWAADVGEKAWEEIDQVTLGGNYGWSCREGTHSFDTGHCTGGALINPVYEYPYAVGGNESITGGFVYRGTAIPSLQGRYVFGDFISGRIYALTDNGQGGYDAEQLMDTDAGVSTFGQGEDGEIYYADYFAGTINKLVPAGGGGNTDPVPDDLADTGCVNALDPTQPASGLIPYSINAAFWSDGAVKTRYLGLPNGTTVSRGSGDWTLPNGTVLMKNFRLNNQLIETRLFMRHPDGAWAGYTYEWNAGQTAATRVRGGKTKVINGQTWIYPSEAQCLQCHTSAAGFSLGLETRQLNRNMLYPSTGRTADQMRTLDHIGVFDTPVPPTLTQIIADPEDTSQPLDERARAYLHVNCSGCHRPGGPTTVSMDLQVTTAFPSTNTCEVAPAVSNLGIGNARLIATGDASRSVVVARMSRRDADGMPPLGSNIVDSDGEALLSAWVNGLTNCN